MNDYEREMQEQAESIARWKLKKEIKRKIKALRKNLRKYQDDLPHLQQINTKIDELENQLSARAQVKKRETPLVSYEAGIPANFKPMMTRTFREKYEYDAILLDTFAELVLIDKAKEIGKELLAEGAIKYCVYDSDRQGRKCIEMEVTVLVDEDIPRFNPAKNIDSPTLPLKKGVE